MGYFGCRVGNCKDSAAVGSCFSHGFGSVGAVLVVEVVTWLLMEV